MQRNYVPYVDVREGTEFRAFGCKQLDVFKELPLIFKAGKFCVCVEVRIVIKKLQTYC
jgi:hypothetical protein